MSTTDLVLPIPTEPLRIRRTVKLKINRHRIRLSLLHVALVMAGSDLVAACWPAFNAVWGPVAHLGVAGGTVLATLADYIETNEVRK